MKTPKIFCAGAEVKPWFSRVLGRLLIRTKATAQPIFNCQLPLGTLRELGTARQWATELAGVAVLAAALALALILI